MTTIKAVNERLRSKGHIKSQRTRISLNNAANVIRMVGIRYVSTVENRGQRSERWNQILFYRSVFLTLIFRGV